MKIRINSQAKADLKAAEGFYESQESGLGVRFRESIFETIDSLKSSAGIHARDFGFQRILAKTFPYIVYYELIEKTVTVVAVIDGRRDPNWIANRLAR